MPIFYRAGYRYQLAADYTYELPSPFAPFCAGVQIPEPLNPFFLILPSCALVAFRGYAWDGASFFLARDTRTTIRSTLIHDVITQAIRLGILPPECRHLADLTMYRVLIEDGTVQAEAWTWYQAVREFGAGSVLESAERPVLTAP